MSEETRVILPHLPKFGASSPGKEEGGGETVTPVNRLIRNVNANKRVMTGLASGSHARKPGGEPLRICGSHSALGTTVVAPHSTDLIRTGIPKDTAVYLPAIEVSEDHKLHRINTTSLSMPNDAVSFGTPVTTITPGGHLEMNLPQRLTGGQPLQSTSDAAYIRRRSVTPSLLGAPRDLLPRSKKASLFAGYLPDLPHSEEDAGLQGNLTLTVEGHHDLKLPPRKTPTESRKVEKSRHKLLMLSSNTAHGSGTDDVASWEDNLKTLLLCRSMGIHLEAANMKQVDHDTERTIRPVFHCARCLQHWAENGTIMQDCDEPEVPVSGPNFQISIRSHEIIQEFVSLSFEDKRFVVDAIMSRESAKVDFDNIGSGSMVDATLLGRQTMKVGESVTKMSTDVKDMLTASLKPSNNDPMPTTHVSSNTMMFPRKHTPKEVVQMFTPQSGERVIVSDIRMTDDEKVVDHNSHLPSKLEPKSGGTDDDSNITTSLHHQNHAKTEEHCVVEHQQVRSISPEKQSLEQTGQYGPDGAYYPGTYGADGRFMANCRVAPDGQRLPVVMGPDGRFYSNAHYGPDGRFHLGENEGDKHGIVFLSATEMAALQANRTPNQGVIGPDGLFYPNGFYQSDGTFIPGGPPHSGHPAVWGPTLGTNATGYKFPPTEFGPAWPPGAPAPYSDELETRDRQHLWQIGDEERTLPNPDVNADQRSLDSSLALQDSNYGNQKPNQVVPTETTSHHEYLAGDDGGGMIQLNSESSSVEQGELNLPRDLFSPWGKDEELQNLQMAATTSASFHQSRGNDYDDEEEFANVKDIGGKERDSCEFDDLDRDVPLSNLDSRIYIVESDDGTKEGFGGVKPLQSSGYKNDTVSSLEDLEDRADVQKAIDVDNDKSNIPVEQHQVNKTASTEAIRPKKPMDSTAAYMGVVDRTDSSYSRRGSSHSQLARTRRGSIDGRTGSGIRGGKSIPGKNRAVKNVTGKPETKPGMLQKHMFATPSATLTQTNTLGINSKRTSRGGSTRSIDKMTVSSKDDILAGNPKLPSIAGGEPTQDGGLSHRSPSPIKQVKHQSMSRIGSGEKRPMSDIDNAIEAPMESVKPRSGQKRDTKLKNKKKAGKEVRKTVGKPRGAGAEVVETKEEASVVEAINGVSEANEPPLLTEQSKEDSIGTYRDIVREAGVATSRVNCEERDSISKLSDSSSLLDKFSEFRVSAPAPPSPLPTEHAPSFRMTYSTLPSFGANEPPLQSTMPQSHEDIPIITEKKPSKSKSIPFDFEKVEKGYDIRARTSSTRSLLTRKSRTAKSGIKSRTRRRSGSVSSDASSGTSTRASSPAESVWESISEIWKRHKEEMANLKKCVADSYLPLTHAYTFSMFPLAPGYADRNRVIWERASAIKQLRKPVTFNKSRRAAKPVKKKSTTVARKPPPVKTV